MTQGEKLRGGVISGETDAIPGLPARPRRADRRDDAGRTVAAAERKLPVRQARVEQPLMRAGVDGEFRPGADGADMRFDQDLILRRPRQVDLAHVDCEWLDDHCLTRFHRCTPLRVAMLRGLAIWRSDV